MTDDMLPIFIAFGVAFVTDATIAWFFWSRYLRYKALQSMERLSAKATITALNEVNRSKSGRSYRISYDFTDYKGTPYSGCHAIAYGLFKALKEQQSITVFYIRKSPQINAYEQSVDALLAMFKMVCIAISGSLVVLIAVALFFYSDL